MAGACNAGDRFQIFVDRQQLTIRPVLVGGPRHHLKQIAIEWYNDERTTVGAVTDSARMFYELLRIRNLHKQDR